MLYNTDWEKKTEVKLEPWREAMLKAADLIEKCGWRQNGFGNENVGFCAWGAIAEVTRIPGYYTDPLEKLDEAVGHIPRWNDNPAQTKENVIATMRRVATD